MSKVHIIADGGGTTTNWCIVNGEERSFFKLESYHPSRWDSDFEERITTFWQNRVDPPNVQLTFFGAGCYNNENRNRTTKLFERIGFTDVKVYSDLSAAGLATLGTKNGWVAIAGTGSVLFNWSGEDVTQVVGGKGRDLGDEGSGHYFGKLVIQAYQNDGLNKDQRILVEDRITKKEIDNLIISKSYSILAHKLHADQDFFQDFHRRNIVKFFETHFNPPPSSLITIVGGYAWHKQHLFDEISNDFDVNILGYLNEPIEALVDQMVLFSD